MQLGGEAKKVTLNTDLTKYDSRLTNGQVGKTIPNVKLSEWGSMDHFVAVQFECGSRMDIAISSLDFDGKYINK